MKIGIAIWPKENAEWVELGLSAVPGSSIQLIEPKHVQALEKFDVLIADGDNPGPSFIAYYKNYVSKYGTPDLIVLGSPMSPAIMNLQWEPDETLFISKPYQIEDVVKATSSKIENLRKPVEKSPEPAKEAAENAAAKEDSKSNSKSLGYLSTLRLSDLIQMLCLSDWTGKIEVLELSTQIAGEIYLNVGVLIHAKQDKLEAEDACYKMLGWGRCEFRFIEEHPPVVQTITTHWQGIMLEGARLVDESKTGTL